MRTKIRRILERIPGGNHLLQLYRNCRVCRLSPDTNSADEHARLNSQLTLSTEKGESVSDWWNQAHTIDEHAWWLTGSSPRDVWDRLEITKRLHANLRVLNIGVGKGLCTKALYEMGCETDALDISEAALAHVRQYTHAQ